MSIIDQCMRVYGSFYSLNIVIFTQLQKLIFQARLDHIDNTSLVSQF